MRARSAPHRHRCPRPAAGATRRLLIGDDRSAPTAVASPDASAHAAVRRSRVARSRELMTPSLSGDDGDLHLGVTREPMRANPDRDLHNSETPPRLSGIAAGQAQRPGHRRYAIRHRRGFAPLRCKPPDRSGSCAPRRSAADRCGGRSPDGALITEISPDAYDWRGIAAIGCAPAWSRKHAPAAAALTPAGAFVVQFRADSDPLAGRAGGRVEHVQSGRAAHFASIDELLRFVSSALAHSRDSTEEIE